MTYCKICELELPTEAKYRDHTELLHPEEISTPAVIATDKESVKKTLEQLGVTVSNEMPEDPIAGQIHYNESYEMYVYDGEKWTKVISGPAFTPAPYAPTTWTTTGTGGYTTTTSTDFSTWTTSSGSVR